MSNIDANRNKTRKNILYGFLGQAITILLGVFIPRLFLINYGSEWNGFLTSISQIFVYFSLLEAGVGTAAIQSLYGPIARNDYDDVNGVISATNKFYKRTGFFYLLAVILTAFIYPLVVPSELSQIKMSLIILINGLPGAINFWVQGKLKLILQAEGKNYVIQNLTTISTILIDAVKITLIMLGCDIVVIQLAFFAVNMLQMVYFAVYFRRKYKWLDLNVDPNYDTLKERGSVLVHNISSLIFSNIDTVLLTFFAGLTQVSVYSLYTMFLTIIRTMVTTINTSINFNLGQAFNNNREEYNRMYNFFEAYFIAIVFGLYCITYIFLNPFMALYTSGVNDAVYVDKYLPILFVAVALLSTGRILCDQTIAFAKHFKQTQWRSILETLINLCVSIVLVQSIGIYGVLIGTIVALLYRVNDIIIYSNKKIMNRSPWMTYKKWFVAIGLFVFIVVISKVLVWEFDSYIVLFLRVVWFAPVVMALFIGVISAIDKEAFAYAKRVIRKKKDI